MMTDYKEKYEKLIKGIKEVAETPHRYDKYCDDFNPNDYTNGEDAFGDGIDCGEIMFARTLLEQIGVEFEYPNSDPCPKCGTELEDARGGGVKCPNKDCDYWFCY